MSETPPPYVAFTPAPIRFRVFDPATGEMHCPMAASRTGFSFGPEGEIWREDPDTYEPVLCAREVVAMLSTGLRDAAGVEVFDGDLVEWDGVTYTVENVLGCFGISTTNGWKVLGTIAAGFPETAHTSRLRVVGNVFEGVREPA